MHGLNLYTPIHQTQLTIILTNLVYQTIQLPELIRHCWLTTEPGEPSVLDEVSISDGRVIVDEGALQPPFALLTL